uniref:medium-chain acyl-CoA ligase n=1 Tax=Sus scrofa TaxID=9823 RepID=A0A8D1HNS8_PIG
MKIFSCYQTFRFIRLTKPPGRRFHKDYQLQVPLTLDDLEAIMLCERPLPKSFNFAADVLDQWSQKEKTGERPANPALWWVNSQGNEVKWSFRELGSLSRKAANVLTKSCGLERGDRVAMILPRIPEWWLLNVACMRTGLVFMPGTTQLTAKDLLYRLRASKAKCIVASDEVVPAVESAASECPDLKTKLLVSPHSRNGWLSFQELFQNASTEHSCVETGSQESMAIFFTSGTSGSPKMAQHSQSSLGIGSAHCGRYKFKSLKHCLTGGEPLNPEVLEQWRAQTGLNLYEGYGQTEVGLICATYKGQEIKPGSMGIRAPPHDVQIIDENGDVLPPGKEGDISIRLTPTRHFSLFSKYVDNPEKTAATIRGGFYVTGDRGVMDSDGYFRFVGRADDVIISAGYRIGPFEVESALIEHPAVAESAVVSSPDPIRGEVVKAFVVLSAPFKSSNPEQLTLELQDHVKKSTAPYKYPRKVEFVQELPKTVTGKIKRNILRDREWGRA